MVRRAHDQAHRRRHEGVVITREQILSLDDLGSELVEVPQWGGVVRVRGMTLGEQDRFELTLREDKALVRARVLTWCVLDADTGRPLFLEGDAPALAQRSAAVFLRLWEAIARLSGLVDEASLGKGSPRAADSPTRSRSDSAAPSES